MAQDFRRHDFSDRMWALLESYLPGRKESSGRNTKDNRLFVAFASFLLPLRIAEAMLEASLYLACKYTQLEYDRENFVTETKSAYEMQLEYDRHSKHQWSRKYQPSAKDRP